MVGALWPSFALLNRRKGKWMRKEGEGSGGGKERDFNETLRTPVEAFSLLDMKPISYRDKLLRRFIKTNHHTFYTEALIFSALYPSLPQSYPLPFLSHQLGPHQGKNWCPAPPIQHVLLGLSHDQP